MNSSQLSAWYPQKVLTSNQYPRIINLHDIFSLEWGDSMCAKPFTRKGEMRISCYGYKILYSDLLENQTVNGLSSVLEVPYTMWGALFSVPLVLPLRVLHQSCVDLGYRRLYSPSTVTAVDTTIAKASRKRNITHWELWSLKHYFLFVYVISILFLPASFLWVTPEEPELTVINVIFERLSFPRRPTEVGPSYTTFTVLSLNRVAGFPHGGHFSSRFGRVGSNIAKSRQWRFHSVSGMAEVNTMNWSIELSLLEVWGFDWLDMGRRGGQPRSRTSCHTNQLSAIRSRLLSFNAVLVHCT